VRAYSQAFATIIIWGIASVVIKITLGGVEPVLFLTFRFFLATIVALFFFSEMKHLFTKKKDLIPLILLYCALSAPIGLGLLFLGLETSSVVNLSLIQASEPILLAFLGHIFFRDHLTHRAKIGATIALLGAILTVVEPLFTQLDGTLKGNLFIVVYILSDLIGVISLKKLLKRGVSPSALTNFSFVLGFLMFLPLLLLKAPLSSSIQTLINLPIKYHLGILYMAFISGTIAYTLRGKAQKFLSVTEISIFGYLAPVISTILALMFLNEKITPLYIAGAAAIAFGVFLVEFKRVHRAK
jgi:drug/metabolite transporter (DMT)-like permease